MLKGPQGQKRPRDVIGEAVMVAVAERYTPGDPYPRALQVLLLSLTTALHHGAPSPFRF
jgi:hypothetical protein